MTTLQRCLIIATIAVSIGHSIFGASEYRLPGHAVPSHYDIKLIPYIVANNFTFDGEVTITFEIVDETSAIVLHANRLDIENDTVTVTSFGNVAHGILSKTYDANSHFYTINLDTILLRGNYSVYIKYKGYLADDLSGFHRLNYTTSSGETSWLAATFFAPVYARQAFPCFDEPAMKARFTLSIAHNTNQIALFNTNLESLSASDPTIENKVWSKFHTTPVISTYIVAFVVSDFVNVSNNEGNLTIWSRPATIDTAIYSLGVSSEILIELNRYTNFEYSLILPSLAQIALPASATTAMENLGLITYRENALLWKDEVSTTRDKYRTATIIAHEFAHQWFGNLVTFSWWPYVWLSEGFATFFEYHTTHAVFPDWRLNELFSVDILQAAFLADSSSVSRGLNEIRSENPYDIELLYDTIAYEKGGSIINMMSHFLSESILQNGLQIYLRRLAYDVATPDDLWAAIQEAHDSANPAVQPYGNIATVMKTWTDQSGYPLVTVNRNYVNSTLSITQERFLSDGRNSSDAETSSVWWVPITYTTQDISNFDSTRPAFWISTNETQVTITPAIANAGWIIFNVQQTGYYRVNYDANNWNMISNFLETTNYTNIPPTNRAQLIDDALNLARVGYLNYTVALGITRYLSQETDYVPWKAAFKSFAFLQTMLHHSSVYSTLGPYLFSRVRPIHNSIGYAARPTDEPWTPLLRSTSHAWACDLGCPGCNTQVQLLMSNYFSTGDDSSIEVDLKEWVYCQGLRAANATVWQFMWGKYLSTEVTGEQSLILAGLGCTLNEEILNKFNASVLAASRISTGTDSPHSVESSESIAVAVDYTCYETKSRLLTTTFGARMSVELELSYLLSSITLNSGVRPRHRTNVFISVYTGHPSNVGVALNFLIDNFEAASRFYGGSIVVRNLLINLASRIVVPQQLSNLRALVASHASELDAAGDTAVTTAERNIEWVRTYQGDIATWLNSGSVSLGASGLIITILIHFLRMLA